MHQPQTTAPKELTEAPRVAVAEPDAAQDGGPVVFVLDDDAQARRAIGRLLRAAGYQVELLGSPREFLHSERGRLPGCLISDLRLPEVDGMNLFALLRRSGQRIPIIFITGYGDIATGVKAMKHGAGWPMGPAALLDLVGADVHVHASEALYEKLREPRMAPPPRLVRMHQAGKLGRKSGEGFHRYDG